MTELDSFLDAIEAEPADDALWLVFADWLEERGDPLSEILRRTVESRAWRDGFDEVSRRVTFRDLQLVACDAAEPLLEGFERLHPGEGRALRRLLEALRRDPDGSDLRDIKREVAHAHRVASDPRRWSTSRLDHYLAWDAAKCFMHLGGWPRLSCVQAAETLANREVEFGQSRLPPRKKKRALRAALELEFRRLVIRSIRQSFGKQGGRS